MGIVLSQFIKELQKLEEEHGNKELTGLGVISGENPGFMLSMDGNFLKDVVIYFDTEEEAPLTIIGTSKEDGTTKEVTLDYCLERTEKDGYWKEGTVEKMLRDGYTVTTPRITFRAK